MTDHTQYIVLAVISLLLYCSLAGVSAFYFFKFRAITLENPHSSSYYRTIGKYDEPKVLFFLVLTIAAILDIPMYTGCLIHGGPVDCEWNTPTYPVFWVFHLLAVCGYAFSITIPCVMWSDMINRKDGKLFFSAFTYDSTKRFFQVCIVFYLINTVVDLLAVIIAFRVSDHAHFQDRNIVDAVCTLIEPMLIFLIACGCLWCGVRLQSHVVQAKLNLSAVIRVLFYLNITMFIICASYLVRGVFILRFVYFLPDEYEVAFEMPFSIWLLCTRWIPYVFCSFCLIASMRSSGAEIAARNIREKTFNPPNGGVVPSEGEQLYAQLVSAAADQDDPKLSQSSVSSMGFGDDETSMLSATLSDLPWRASQHRLVSVERDDPIHYNGEVVSQFFAYSPPNSSAMRGSVSLFDH
eukprot:gene11669-13081_t